MEVQRKVHQAIGYNSPDALYYGLACRTINDNFAVQNMGSVSFQAAMGLCNLENINEKILFRKRLYEYYKKELARLSHIRFQKLIASKYNYAYVPVLFSDQKERDRVYIELLDDGVKTRKYFYPLVADYKYIKKEEDLIRKYRLKNALDISTRILCLPLYPDLRLSEVKKIISIIKHIIQDKHNSTIFFQEYDLPRIKARG